MGFSLSIITTGRNDNYDGDFNERLAISLARHIESLPYSELIFVEWNPILNKPLTCSFLKNIFGGRVKYYVIHPKFQCRYCSTPDMFGEWAAKNAAIRRCLGEFILCTNSDVIFDPELVCKLKGELSKRTVYRANRIDIRPDYLRVAFPLNDKYRIEENKGYMNASGDFLLADRDTWFETTGYCEAFPEQKLHKDAFLVYIMADLMKMPVVNLGSFTHWRHASSWSNGFKRTDCGDVRWNFKTCGYTKNGSDWGLGNVQEVNRDGIIWLE